MFYTQSTTKGHIRAKETVFVPRVKILIHDVIHILPLRTGKIGGLKKKKSEINKALYMNNNYILTVVKRSSCSLQNLSNVLQSLNTKRGTNTKKEKSIQHSTVKLERLDFTAKENEFILKTSFPFADEFLAGTYVWMSVGLLVAILSVCVCHCSLIQWKQQRQKLENRIEWSQTDLYCHLTNFVYERNKTKTFIWALCKISN